MKNKFLKSIWLVLGFPLTFQVISCNASFLNERTKEENKVDSTLEKITIKNKKKGETSTPSWDFTLEKNKYQNIMSNKFKTDITLPNLGATIQPYQIGYKEPTLGKAFNTVYKLKKGWHGSKQNKFEITAIITKGDQKDAKDIVVSTFDFNNLEEISEDGLYLHKYGVTNSQMFSREEQYYMNKCWDGKLEPFKGKHSTKWWEQIKGRGFATDIVQMEKGDSIFMVYDEDDNDGFAPKNFVDNLFFHDSSTYVYKSFYHDSLADVRKEIGTNENFKENTHFQIMKIWGGWIKVLRFMDTGKQGYLTTYSGSNYFHPSDDIDTKQDFTKPVFKYEKVADRVFRITLNSSYLITAAKFALRSTKNPSTTSFQKTGVFSIGPSDWKYYQINNTDYEFLSIKNSAKEKYELWASNPKCASETN